MRRTYATLNIMTSNDVRKIGKVPQVLIIEDDLFLLKAYGIKCKKEGWEAILLSEGAQAIDYLNKPPPDVVLLDIMLPGTSGFQILEDLRKNDQWKSVPVFVLTNLSEKKDRERARELGATEYIVKSDSKIDDIIEKVRKVLTP